MGLLRLASLVGITGIIVFLIGLFLARLLGTIQRVSNYLCQPLSLGFIDYLKAYLPSPNQILHPKHMMLYLRNNDISFSLVFSGGVAILAAAVMIIIVVFCRVLV